MWHYLCLWLEFCLPFSYSACCCGEITLNSLREKKVYLGLLPQWHTVHGRLKDLAEAREGTMAEAGGLLNMMH